MLFHAECGKELPAADDTVRLWWIAVNQAEVALWTTAVEAGGGKVISSTARNPHFPVQYFHADFVFECSVAFARTYGYDDTSLFDSALVPEEDGTWPLKPKLNDG